MVTPYLFELVFVLVIRIISYFVEREVIFRILNEFDRFAASMLRLEKKT
jgi:hypothetical protein